MKRAENKMVATQGRREWEMGNFSLMSIKL